MAAFLDAILSLKARVEGGPAVQRLGQEIGALGREAKGAVGGLKGMAGNVSGLSAVLGALGPLLSIGGIAALGNQAIEAGDKFWDLSQKTGVSVEALAKFGKAAKLNGTDVDGVAKALQKLSKGMMDAATTGSGPAAGALKVLGISAVDSAGKLRGADEVMLQVADRFKTMPDGAQKTALALQLFGKAGADMIPMLNQGGAAIEKLSVKMTTEFAQRADEYKDKMTALGGAVSGMGVTIANELLPTLIEVTTRVTEFVKGIGTWVDENKSGIQGTLNFINAFGTATADLFRVLIDQVGHFARVLGRLSVGDFAGAIEEAKTNTQNFYAQMQNDFNKLGQILNGTAQGAKNTGTAINGAKQELAGLTNEQEIAKQKQAEWNAFIAQSELAFSRLHFTMTQTQQAADGQLKIMDARVAAEVAVNNAAKTGLLFIQETATTEKDKLAITQRIADIDIANAGLQLKLAVAQEQATLKQIQLKIQDAKLSEAKAAAELAGAKARGLATEQYQKTLEAQAGVVQLAIDEYNIAKQIAPLKQQAAQATYDAAVMQAKANVEAVRMQIQQSAVAQSSGVALNNIRQIPTSLDAAVIASSSLADNMSSAADSAGRWRAAKIVTPRFSNAFGQSFGALGMATGAFVTGPTAAIVGEGGEPEYVIPSSKMAGASSAYLAGARGPAVLSGGGGAAGPAQINITTGPVLQANGETWVTVKDLERAMRTTADSVLSRVRTPAARRVLGIR